MFMIEYVTDTFAIKSTKAHAICIEETSKIMLRTARQMVQFQAFQVGVFFQDRSVENGADISATI